VKCDICGYYAGDEEAMSAHIKREHGSSLFDYGADPNEGSDR